MARPPFTLAALATAAVPGLEVTAARAIRRGTDDGFDAVELLGAGDRHLVVRVPRTQAAESEQSAELVALHALSRGIRSRLPFTVPELVGQAPIQGTRAVVTEYIDGAIVSSDELTSTDRRAEAIGTAIAAIHGLPPAFIGEAGLTRHDAAAEREAVVELIGRSSDTGRLPAALVRRWEEATDDASLWRFQPSVVHGSLSNDCFIVDADRVAGVIGWSGLAFGDPARDLHWLLTSRGPSAGVALDAYLRSRGGAADAHLPQRALLHGELELARWLLHGVALHDAHIIDDAQAMLDALVSQVHDHVSEPLSAETGPIMTVDDVERLLDGTPRAAPAREGGALLTDSYDDFDVSPRERDDLANATAPMPLDLSDWGDAGPAQTVASDDVPAEAASDSSVASADPSRDDDDTDSQTRRSSSSS